MSCLLQRFAGGGLWRFIQCSWFRIGELLGVLLNRKSGRIANLFCLAVKLVLLVFKTKSEDSIFINEAFTFINQALIYKNQSLNLSFRYGKSKFALGVEQVLIALKKTCYPLFGRTIQNPSILVVTSDV